MAKPSQHQASQLAELRDFVIDVMREMPVWKDANVEQLRCLNLGVLRKNATQRHGVTRWKRGVDANSLTLENVDTIDLHPQLLDARWKAYSAFVLHHEYIHALGYREHNSLFRTLEDTWPGRSASSHGLEFTEHLRRLKAVWLWCCPTCEKEFPRQKPSRRRYRCRTCNSILFDKKNPALFEHEPPSI